MPELSLLQLIIIGIGGILPTALTSALIAHNFSQDIYDLLKYTGNKYQEIKNKLRRPPSIKLTRSNNIDDKMVFAFDELPFESSNYIVSITLDQDQQDANLLSLDFPNWETAPYKITITDSKTNTVIESTSPKFTQIIKKLQESYNNSLTDLATNNRKISDIKVGEIICASTTLAEDHKKLQNPASFDIIAEAITTDIINNNHQQSKQTIKNYYTAQKTIGGLIQKEFAAELGSSNENLKLQEDLLSDDIAVKAKKAEAKKKAQGVIKKKPLSHNAKAAFKWLGIIATVGAIATVAALLFPVAIPLIATVAAAAVSGFGVMVVKFKKELFSGLAFVKITNDFKQVGIRHYKKEAEAIKLKICTITKEIDDLTPAEENTTKIIDFIHTLNFSETKELNLSKQKLGIIDTKIICQNLYKNEKFSKCNKIILPKTATTEQVTEFIAAAAKTANIQEINSSTKFTTMEEVKAIESILSINLTITELAYGQASHTIRESTRLETQLAINRYIKTGKSNIPGIQAAAEAKIIKCIASQDEKDVEKYLCKLLEVLGDTSVIYKTLLLTVIDQKSILSNQDLAFRVFMEACKNMSAEELQATLANGTNISIIQGINTNSAILSQLRSLGDEKLTIVTKAFFPENSKIVADIINEYTPKRTNKNTSAFFFTIGKILSYGTIKQNATTVANILQEQEAICKYFINQDPNDKDALVKFINNALLYIKKLQQTGKDAGAALDELLTNLGDNEQVLLPDIITGIINQHQSEIGLFIEACNKIPTVNDLESILAAAAPNNIYALIKEDFKTGSRLFKTLNKKYLQAILDRCLAINTDVEFTIEAKNLVNYAINNFISAKITDEYKNQYIDITDTYSLLNKILSPGTNPGDKKSALTQLSIYRYLKTGEYTDQTIPNKAEDEVKNHVKKLHEKANIGRIEKFVTLDDIDANVINGFKSLPELLGDNQASQKALLLAIIDSVEIDKSNVVDSELELFVKICNKITTIKELEQILTAVSPKKIYLLIKKDFENNCTQLQSLKEKLPTVLAQCFTSSNSPDLKKKCIEYAVTAINSVSSEKKNSSVNVLNIILSPSTSVDVRNTTLSSAKTKSSVLPPDIIRDDKKPMPDDAKKDSERKILEKISNQVILKLQEMAHIKNTKKIEKMLNEVLVNLETVPADAHTALLSTLALNTINEPSTVRDLKLKIFVEICKKNSIDNLSLILPQESLEPMGALIIKSINDRSDIFALLQSLGDKLPIVLHACFPENNEMNINSMVNIIKKHATVDDENKEESKRFFALGKILLCNPMEQGGIAAIKLLQQQELILDYLKTGNISNDLQIKLFIAKLTDYIKNCLPKDYKSEEDESERLLTNLTTSLGDTPAAHKALLLAIVNIAEDKKINKKINSLVLNIFVKTCKKIESIEEIKRILAVSPDNLLALVREDITNRALTPLKSLDDNYLKAIIGTLLLDYNDMALTNIIVWHIKKYRATNEDAYKGIPELIELILSPDTTNEKKDIAIKTLKGETIKEPSLLGKLFNVFGTKKAAPDAVVRSKKVNSNQILKALTNDAANQDRTYTHEMQLKENEIEDKKPVDRNSPTIQIDKKLVGANNPTPNLTPTKNKKL